MKILQIVPQAPGCDSGGALGVVQTTISLIGNGYDVDYIGPSIIDDNLKKMFTHVYELSESKNLLYRVWDLLHGITNSRYRAWKDLSIDFEKYDAIVMDFTKLDYILNRINCKKLFVRIHNIEADYTKRDYINKKSISKYIIMKLSVKQERKIVKNANCLIVLTEHDRKRLFELYGEVNRIETIPVCVKNELKNCSSNKKEILKILITGSLWFGENYNGILWFIKNVCPKIKGEFILTIAGSHPTKELREIAKENNFIKLIDTPNSMLPYFKETDLVVAPIFNGAGMKVKVAEAFSYGKPVIGTEHVFLGYKIENGKNSFLANTDIEFAEAINSYTLLSKDEKEIIVERVRKLFRENYDLEVSKKLWKNILEKERYDNN